MGSNTIRVLGAALLAATLGASFTPSAWAGAKSVERGKYLVTLTGCGDCHTPGFFMGKPEPTRFLGGSDVGWEMPNLGIFYPPNLTPDRETGLGTWTRGQIVTAITKGQRPDGRELAPIMPWRDLAALTKSDALAIADYLKSLPPVKNKVPGPFPTNEKPIAPYWKMVTP
jgi:mono/diheme cytochrome c family protein